MDGLVLYLRHKCRIHNILSRLQLFSLPFSGESIRHLNLIVLLKTAAVQLSTQGDLFFLS